MDSFLQRCQEPARPSTIYALQPLLLPSSSTLPGRARCFPTVASRRLNRRLTQIDILMFQTSLNGGVDIKLNSSYWLPSQSSEDFSDKMSSAEEIRERFVGSQDMSRFYSPRQPKKTSYLLFIRCKKVFIVTVMSQHTSL